MMYGCTDRTYVFSGDTPAACGPGDLDRYTEEDRISDRLMCAFLRLGPLSIDKVPQSRVH